MSVHIANIDLRNLSRLDRAKEIAGVDYEAVVVMTVGSKGNVDYSFRPILCETHEDGEKLLREYIKLALEEGEKESLSFDLFSGEAGIQELIYELTR